MTSEKKRVGKNGRFVPRKEIRIGIKITVNISTIDSLTPKRRCKVKKVYADEAGRRFLLVQDVKSKELFRITRPKHYKNKRTQ